MNISHLMHFVSKHLSAVVIFTLTSNFSPKPIAHDACEPHTCVYGKAVDA